MASIHLDKHGIYAQLREKHTFPRLRNCITCTSLRTPCPCVYMNFQIIAWLLSLKAHANVHNIVGQQDATLLGPTCCERLHTMLCVVVCCCDLLEVVGWSLKLVKLQSQQVPTFLLFRVHLSVVQLCCIRLHSTSNNVARAPKSGMYGIVGIFVPASFVFSSKDPTCCDLLRAFAHIGKHCATRDNTVGPKNVSCCASVCTGL